MDTAKLKKFAQTARQEILEQVGSKLGFVLKPESPARREYPGVVKELEKAITAQGESSLIDQVAYTWFNRFCALRFMDVNGYNRIGIVSPAEGQVQPEILAEAKSGVIDDTQINANAVLQIRGLLNGSVPSPDGQSEAYRLLIVGTCNALYSRMPYLFERIQDFTELLMPDDLLSDNSILTKMRAVMTAEICQDVEVIGWLYQFYISEKKDEVFAGLKKNQKITAENIPAATQLFTPHWIVRYLVENSLGRLWMLNRPNSKLTEQMEYYITPEEPESDFLKISSPEEIRLADPAAGSGHMLTYAFDLLYAIYEEEGYDQFDIPGLILKNNLYGIEIDERAGALASFALEMKAAEKLGRRRFFRMEAKPNVCVLEDVSFTQSEMDDVIAIVGKDLYTADLRETLTQFEQAKNFGSLIVPKLKDPADTARLIEAKDFSGDLLLNEVHERLVKVLRMAEFLAPKYHVVVANPPYMGGKGMNGKLVNFAKEKFPESKADLFAMFISRSESLLVSKGLAAFVTMQSWMFLSSFENMRREYIKRFGLLCCAHLGAGAFPEIGGQAVQVVAFVQQRDLSNGIPIFGRYVNGKWDEKREQARTRQNLHKEYRQEEFGDFPATSFAYWISRKVFSTFKSANHLEDVLTPRQGMATSDNERFLRFFWEISNSCANRSIQSLEGASLMREKWVPYNKGGAPIKFYGNQELVVNWANGGSDVLSYAAELYGSPTRTIKNMNHYFRRGITWSDITFRNSKGEESFAARISPGGFIFDVKGSSGFPSAENTLPILGLLNSKVLKLYMSFMNPSSTFQVGDIRRIPYITSIEGKERVNQIVSGCLEFAKLNYDSFETSWDFTKFPLLSEIGRDETLDSSYINLCAHWQSMTDEMQRLEEENNRIFIEAYGLQDELKPEVPIEEITLTCNPAYRYGIKISEEDREARLKADTMAEFLSYAVGCMFGRYSLDEPGLILANQGETLADYLARIPEPTFMPDDDNVIPMIDFDGDWFEDDITERFKQFLRVTFGDEHYGENVTFIEDALGKSLQKYFVKDFYNDHVKRYKKRPIYWLFSSPKGTFNALIYMHRYTPSTVSVVLNEYLREFRTKLEARRDSNEQISISGSASQKEKTQALKMIDKLNKAIDEVNDYEREVLYPLATENIALDLDDGVKHNYPLFGKALKKIVGLS